MYGETSFELVTAMVASTHLSENDVFLDLGSGECDHAHALPTPIVLYPIRMYNVAWFVLKYNFQEN